jgi:ribonuclease HI
MKKVIIYTDGACSGNPGAGGWGAILKYGGHEKEISGFESETTNNQMELTAAIKALNILKEPCKVELYSDSAYLVNAFEQGWMQNWKQNGWRKKDDSEVKNLELWQELDRLCHMHDITWIKVKGHSDNEFNNRCDKLATGEIKKNNRIRNTYNGS